MARYRKAGARYFMTMANHHDNFDNFDSKHHRWNSVAFGPKRDIVGTWEKIAREAGIALRGLQPQRPCLALVPDRLRL
jgi:alpha-L-fucosidase